MAKGTRQANSGSFKAGNSGKPKGAKQKKTLILESFAQSIVEGGMERFQEELNKLEGKEYTSTFLVIFEFVKPKLQRTDTTMELKDKTLKVIKEIVGAGN